MSDLTGKQKVAVLGGGLGSLTTVYGLTSDPSWRDKYDITVYQIGWRLGGKGASGRNRQHNQRMWDPLESTCRHASLSIL